MEHHTEQVDASNAQQTGVVKKMLALQAEDAADRLRACPRFWQQLANSHRLKKSLVGGVPDQPSAMTHLLMDLDHETHETLQKVMRQICKEFEQAAQAESDPEACNLMEQATVSLYLLCICRLIEVKSPKHLSGIPSLESDEAVNLFAILIAAVMAGGKLVLAVDQERKAFVPKHVYAVQWRSVPDIGLSPSYGAGLSIAPKDQFERGLYLAVMRDEVMPEEGLDLEPLSDQQRADLIERLSNEREDDDDRNAMCVVLFGEEPPADIDTEIVRSLDIPVFSEFHPDIAFALLGGLTAERFIAKLKELLRVIRSGIDTASPFHARQSQNAKAVLDELRQKLSELVAASPEHPQVAKIREFLDAFENIDHDVTPQRREILTRTRDAMEKFRDISDFADTLAPRVLELLAQLSRIWPSS